MGRVALDVGTDPDLVGSIARSVSIVPADLASRRLQRDAAFEVFSDMVLAGQALVEATFTMLIRVCVADSALDAAAAVLASAHRRDLKLKLRTYSPLLRARCWHGELNKALALTFECMAAGSALGEGEHCELVVCRGRGLRGDSGFEEAGGISDPRAMAPLDAMAHDCHLPSRTAWGAVETYMSALEPAWTVRRDAEVSPAGTCSTCGVRLRSVDLIPADRALLLRQIEGLVPRTDLRTKTSLCADVECLAHHRMAQWATYTQWLEDRHAPYDCVIDGANVGFHHGSRGNVLSHIDFGQIDSVVRHCIDLGRRCLVVLHMRHLAEDRLPTCARPVVRSWRRAKILYSCSLQNNDDWYWLYAAVWGGVGTILVSNDEMRDHHFGMLSARAFLIWKERHLTKFDLQTAGLDRRCKVVLRLPPPFSARMQHTDPSGAPESWHIPAPPHAPLDVERSGLLDAPQCDLSKVTWLCCCN
eukprot:CAMPEP_0119263202 /NCGR_PEP_ID=MMETSP1329-20130426/2682_1 /TAXON_ID=114041 /ORGANISM="Genus nov. species nov., Strain RCC1024" /LENGTH=472 /DNA_ID=CAMNT_0007262901 /DNA_START=525 /DNA_END=1943 /DNA_ORIENTATION=-